MWNSSPTHGTISLFLAFSFSPFLQVRSFKPEDAEAVRRICQQHFRSLYIPAVRYYIVEHFHDLIVLLVIGKMFHTWTQFWVTIVLFLVYLVIRARIEMVSVCA